ncbi:MAG: 8-amino-7-oxononanoate synthase [Yaniella sp.]|uniref:8-amino-7-oxononanoate synthase n=1 Tax=Yaniella sp. TaxID=2773929 RepID=UPI002649BAAC|nr:8-amino-7-oxononanoate synthase [Yaniella sp.]MDN5703784.1 8-amino-7-oxononanoate synthase [Yaniella sp.]MDN5731681.1 8-amino-7-oxononanoate synthase [Yaniella sp.]MDN5742973.1 8-amino-7-oxononanoate synthase [Yaniella sp.]MDN5815625.1 8-amino-7-oxononanoate synthase [Yaniella sp.]MDN5818109.1 8-amino-7-oxononanoate synthase [Yaniella sp.]
MNAPHASTLPTSPMIIDRLARQAEHRGHMGLARSDGILAARGVLDLAGNDYLGLSQHSHVCAAAAETIHTYGTSARASRLVTGTTAAHLVLEEALCELTGRASALVFSSGYTANLGVITALTGPDTLIISDAHNHASIIDGARLSKAPVHIVAHNSIAAVEQALANRTQPEALVITESVFSVLGDAADVETLAQLCARYDAMLLIDEAHGIGVLNQGRGLAAVIANYADRIVITATLSKALGSQGGAVLGPPVIRETLVNSARSFIFDTGLAPANAAAATAAIGVIQHDTTLMKNLAMYRSTFAKGLGITPAIGAVQSVPMVSPQRAVEVRDVLATRGIAVGCFRPPSVPDGVSRLRITARGDLERDQVDWAVQIIAEELAHADD